MRYLCCRRAAAAVSQTPEQDIRGQQEASLLPRFIQRQGKGKNPRPTAWGRRVSLPVLEKFQFPAFEQLQCARGKI